MNKRDALEVGIKLFGLYFLVQLIGGIAVIAAMAWGNGQPLNNWLYTAIPIGLTLVACVLCLWQGRRIAEWLTKDSPGEPAAVPTPALGQLSFWLRILGLFFGTTATIGLATLILNFLVDDHTLSLHAPGLMDDLVRLAISLALVFKNVAIANFIEKCGRKKPAS